MIVAAVIAIAVAAQAGTPPAPDVSTPTTTTPKPPPTTPDATPEEQYKRGKNAFEYNDCANAILLLAPLSVPGRLQDENEQGETYRMLGVCYAMSDNQLEAARAFGSLLSIFPDYPLDHFTTPPKAVEAFDRQKDAMKAQLDEVRHAKEQRDAAKAKEAPTGGILVERTVVVKNSH